MDRRAQRPVASLARRLFGYILDGLVLLPVYLAYGVLLDALLGPLLGVSPGGDALVVVAVSPGRVALELTLTLLTDAVYYAGSWSRWGMTPGQRLFGVTVRPVGDVVPAVGPRAAVARGGRIPASAAASRWAVLQVPSLCLGVLAGAGAIPVTVVLSLNAAWFGLLFLTTAADPLLRGLHDRVGGTVVVRLTATGA